MHWWNRATQFLRDWIGDGILFSVRRGLWLSRLSAAIVMVVVTILYGWQCAELVLIQSRLERARRDLSHLQAELLSCEDEQFKQQRRLQALRTADETLRAIQSLTGDRLSVRETAELADIILRQSYLYGYDPLLIVAIIQVESRFRSAAYGKLRSGELSGAGGLMQIKPSTVASVARRLGMEPPTADLMDAETNVMWGVTYLTRLLLHFRDLRTAIIAYNMGIGTVEGKLERGEILPRDYYHNVMSYYDRLQTSIR